MSTDSGMSLPPGGDLHLALFERYWLGEASPAEMARVEAWFRAHPEQQAWYTRFGAKLAVDDGPVRSADEWARRTGAILRSSQVLASSARSELAGGVVVTKLFGSRPKTRRVPYVFPRTAGLGVAIGAAILVAILLIGDFVPRWRQSATPTPVSTAERQYVAAPGRRAVLHLSDGTTVTLAPGSTLRAMPRFGMDVRDVYLTGEAYFEVSHDSRVPFRVQTAQGLVEDIGTKFTVRSHAREATSRVVVTEGKVAVGMGIVLGAGDVALLAANTPPAVRRGVAVGPLVAWTTGELVFSAMSLREVVQELARWYGVEIRIDDPALANQTVTIRLREQPVRTVLSHIARMVEARVEPHGAGWALVPAASGVPADRH